MKGKKPPKAPDLIGAARTQGELNTEAARLAASLNRVNTQGPGGSVSYQQDGDKWTQTTNLSPEQQQLYDTQVGNANTAAQGAQSRLTSINQMGAPDFSGLPDRASGVQSAPYRTQIMAPSVAQTGVQGTGPYQTGINAPSAGRSNLDFSQAPELTNDFSAERQRVEDSIYGRATGRLDPQFQQSEEQLRTRLLNSGIREGSEAWKNEQQRASWEKQDAYGGARDSAIQAGGAEQSRLFADALARRQQSVGETTTQGNFENQAVQQRFGNEATRTGQFNSAQDQQFNQNLARGQFANDATQQRFGNETARTSLYNQGQDTQFSQGITNANLNNQARDAGISEQMTARNQQLQELLAMYGITGPGATTGAPVPQVQGAQAPDIYGATQDQYGANLEQYNARQARNSSTFGNVLNAGLGAASIFFSDRRLKTDIEPHGELSNGLKTYRYRYVWEDRPRVGVMADEIAARFPNAVLRGADGYDRVDYAAIDATHLLEMV